MNSMNDAPAYDNLGWVAILPWVKLGPHRRHFFQLEAKEELFTHVKLTIYPDGGIKRVRIIGIRGKCSDTGAVAASLANVTRSERAPLPAMCSKPSLGKVLPVLPLTPEAFAPFGQVIQGYGDHAAAPPGVKITPANGGTASKFHKLALLKSTYPEGLTATSGLSVYRCNPVQVIDGMVEVNVLERHPYTNQAFIPMGGGGLPGDEAIQDPGKAYLVVVAYNGDDDKPDLSTLRAFAATAAQGVMYNIATWRECDVPMKNE